MDLVWPSKDTVTVEIPIDVPEYTLSDGSTTNLIPLEFVLVKRRELKNIFSTFSYLKNFVSPVQAKNMKVEGNDPNQLIVLAESEEQANYVIDAQVGDVLSKMGNNNILELHITDQKAYNNS